MKIPGTILILASCTGMGYGAVIRLRQRRKLLEQLRKMASHLKGEILYANAPLSEAMKRTGRKYSGEAGAFFEKVAEELKKETGEPFREVWLREAEKFCQKSVLNPKEREEFSGFGEHLGCQDRKMQEKTILFYLEDLERSIQELRKEEPEKEKLFFSMGIISGLFLILLMI